MASHKTVFPILGVVQNYPWGKIGNASEVAQFFHLNSGQSLDEKQPYAELWMGTHPKGPSKLSETQTPLSDILSKNQALLGEKVIEHWPKSQGLPFLFKVLSINKALSIQSHPDKKLAERLHKEFPKLYADDNHKPELALATTDMEAMFGFRPISEIQTFLKTVPELSNVVGNEKVVHKFLEIKDGDIQETRKQALKELFTCIMNQENKIVETQIQALVARLSKSSKQPADELALRLNEQFPLDIGIFSAYLLNYMVLHPGDAIFINANEPHAYISGDCMECMANSDNVVRAGLTPKEKDVKTLCEMLTYRDEHPQLLKPHQIDANCFLYKPNSHCQEFALEKIEIQANSSYEIHPSASGSILLVQNGNGKVQDAKNGNEFDINRGSILYLAANEKLPCQANSNPIVIFRCRAGIQ